MEFKTFCAISLALIIGLHASEANERSNPFERQTLSEEVPRVNIKVFRGPTEEQDGESFARWGLWVKQPSG